MPRSAPSFSPLRLFTPIQLGFCLILFFLPWIEVQCVPPADQVKNVPKEQVEKAKKEFGVDPTKRMSLYSQSGLQIATGNVSLASDARKIQDAMKKQGMNTDLDPNSEANRSKKTSKDDDLKGAPLLFLYPVAALAGIIVAFIPMPSMVRRLVLAGCCAGALGVIGLQALIGFPIENEFKKKSEEMKGFGGMGLGGPGGGKTKSGDKAEDIIRLSWQFPLYITFLLLLGATGTSFLDTPGAGAYGKKKKKKPVYDYDDEDDDEDDRPRKKKKKALALDDDEDDDDRPRKNRRRDDDDDDEEEERPRKKKRVVDEDDEDDRPRKKKPAEPEFQMPAAAPPPPPPSAAAPAGDNPFAFDTDDDRPRKKRRRDDDEDDDDRPRKKKRRRDDDDD